MLLCTFYWTAKVLSSIMFLLIGLCFSDITSNYTAKSTLPWNLAVPTTIPIHKNIISWPNKLNEDNYIGNNSSRCHPYAYFLLCGWVYAHTHASVCTRTYVHIINICSMYIATYICACMHVTIYVRICNVPYIRKVWHQVWWILNPNILTK